MDSTDQLTLFPLHWGTVPPPAPPHNKTPTSRRAAEEITTVAGRLRQQVYQYILDQGESGATDAEVQLGLGLPGSTERPRRGELAKAGLIRDACRTRLTPAGRAATVWVATGDCVIAKPDVPRL